MLVRLTSLVSRRGRAGSRGQGGPVSDLVADLGSSPHIESASDAARALAPLAGGLASTLFAVGLIGAALLAAAILPLSTAYSVCDLTGSQAALDSTFSEARLF